MAQPDINPMEKSVVWSEEGCEQEIPWQSDTFEYF